jgi:hypothetical protein
VQVAPEREGSAMHVVGKGVVTALERSSDRAGE